MTASARTRLAMTALGFVALAGMAGCLSPGDPAELAAAFEATVGDDGTSVAFDASSSTGPIDEYHWLFGDGSTGQGKVVEKQYNQTDTTAYVSLLVVDGSGASATTYKEVSLGTEDNGAPRAELVTVNRWVQPNQTVRLAANVSDPDGDDVATTWVFGRIPPEQPPEARYATGTMAPGDETTGRFDLAGVYVITSEEHPWMRTQLVVEDTPDAPQNVTVAIRNHAIHQGAPVSLAPGGTVQFVNEDPDNRSLAVAYAALGTAAGSDAAFTTPALDSGRYQATLILEDGKGGLTFRSWGVRASTDAPILPDETYTGQNIIQQGEHLHHGFPGDVLFPAMVWGNATWEASPVPEPVVHLAITLRGMEDPVGPEASCDATRCTLAGMLSPGSYDWEIEFEAGVFDSYEIVTSYHVFGEPEDGDGQWSQSVGHGWGD